ncbi:MAG: hypothetical protein R3330_05095, partial [Saprospiraceae bacterium]|nr:hypothetical protein [Saprospiraceae bacterium]
TNVGSSEQGAAYRTVVGPASQVTANVSTAAPDNTDEIQSVTLFVVRSDQECSQGATGQSGILIFHACDTLEFGNIEAGAQPRDLELIIPISELGSSTLPAILEITLLDNGIVYDMYRDTIYGIPDNVGNFLAIYDTTFSNVPGTLDSVSIAFISPGIGAPIDESCEFGNGDSFIVGTVILSIACDAGACCEITCGNPPNDTLQCLTDLPPVPANLLDSVGAVNGMGLSLDSLAFVDTLGGTFSHGFCDFFITLADTDTVGSGCAADPYIVIRTYDILFDSSGVFLLDTFCSHTFVIFDTTAPMIVCPADVTVECNTSTAPGATGMATATDNCDPNPSITFSDAVSVGACPQESTIIRTWVATDACGNSTSCAQTITVDDSTPPIISCPADVTIACTDSSDPGATGTATATDNCSTPTVTYSDASGAGSCQSTITRTWIATDACGNSTACVQTITIEDTVPPMISCPADVTIECDVPFEALYSVASQDDMIRQINMTTAATESGTVMTLAGFTVTGATGLALHPATQELFVVLKVNGGRRLATVDPQTGVCTDIGALSTGFAGLAFNADGSVLWGVTGDGGTPSETLFEIDQTNASETIVCALGNGDDGETIAFNPADGALYHASGHTGASVIFERIDDIGTDPCSVTNIDILGSVLQDEEAQALTWWPQQGAFFWKQGHFANAPLFLVQTDGTAALIGTMDHQAKGLALVSATGVATATDNCDPAPGITYSDAITPGMCTGESTVIRTWIATDACGNSTTCTQVIELIDTTPPSITAPADVTVECIGDVMFGPANATDNCDPAPMVTFADMTGNLVSGTLSGGQEVPPAATPASGTVTGGYDPVTQMFFVYAEFSGLTGTLTAS